MTPYCVRLKPRAEREMDKLPLAMAKRIWTKLFSLEIDLALKGLSSWKELTVIEFESVITESSIRLMIANVL